MDQRDLARWLTTLLLRGTAQRAYNVGSDEAVSIAELASKVAVLAPGRKPDVHIMNQSLIGQSTDRNFYLPDISRAREELGLSVEINLEAAIRYVFCAKVKNFTYSDGRVTRTQKT